MEGAIAVLTEALATAERFHSRVYMARALAHEAQGDLQDALTDMDCAVNQAENAREESMMRFSRAVYRSRLGTPAGRQGAIDDYTRVLELNTEPMIRMSALNYRGLHHAALGQIDAALADWGVVIDQAQDLPRAAAQARLNRAGSLRQRGKLVDAMDDLTAVISWPDTSSKQRFRALQGRAEIHEQLANFAAAANDIEAMLAMELADPQWRPELKEKARALRESATGSP
jgi:tetratricopeptide (TPR) repeat protein